MVYQNMRYEGEWNNESLSAVISTNLGSDELMNCLMFNSHLRNAKISDLNFEFIEKDFQQDIDDEPSNFFISVLNSIKRKKEESRIREYIVTAKYNIKEWLDVFPDILLDAPIVHRFNNSSYLTVPFGSLEDKIEMEDAISKVEQVIGNTQKDTEGIYIHNTILSEASFGVVQYSDIEKKSVVRMLGVLHGSEDKFFSKNIELLKSGGVEVFRLEELARQISSSRDQFIQESRLRTSELKQKLLQNAYQDNVLPAIKALDEKYEKYTI